jgi:hypothetical protein
VVSHLIFSCDASDQWDTTGEEFCRSGITLFPCGNYLSVALLMYQIRFVWLWLFLTTQGVSKTPDGFLNKITSWGKVEKIYKHYRVHSTFLRIHLSQNCLNITLCRWPPCRSIHFCSRDGIVVVRCCSISLGIPWIHSRFRCFKSATLAGCVFYTLLLSSPRGHSLVLHGQVSRRAKWCPRKENCVCTGTLSWGLAWKFLLCSINK